MSRSSRTIVPALVIFVLVTPALYAQDDKVFRALAPDATEKLLTDLKIEYKKTSSKKGDEHYFDFARNNFRIRLTQFTADEFMLDCVFRNLPGDKVNDWNSLTRFARVSAHKDTTGDFTLMEYGLDISGGATVGTIKQFIVRFDEELRKFDKFVVASGLDDTILAAVTNDTLENLLKTQGLNYKKSTNAAGVAMFDFELSNHKLRLYNFGGKDLMIDAHFKKIALEDANRYNLNRKYVRAVNYKGKDVEYTALEINLDCEAGVSEGMIRNWILSFGDDVRHFSEYAKGKMPQTAEKK